jgi:site-specific recombinase XerD
MNLQDAVNEWLESVKENKSVNTYKTSLAASREFIKALGNMPLEKLDQEQYSIFLSWLKKFSPSTEKLYATIMYLFYEHLAYRQNHPVNIAAMRYLRRNETRKLGVKLREVDTELLEEFRDFVFNMGLPEDLTLARAKAWITLAFESGLRAFEVCGLRMGSLNLSKQYGVIVGKGDKEAKFYFTDRSVLAIRWYFRLRVNKEQGRAANVPIESQPVFVSHSKRGFKHLSPIDTDTARADIRKIVSMAFDDEQKITPHLIRHFFVNAILEATDNPETARLAARHESLATTQRYLHTDEKKVRAAHRKAFGKDENK